MSNPLLSGMLSVMAAQAGRAYIEKHGHSNFVALWGTALVWTFPGFSMLVALAPFFRENPSEPFYGFTLVEGMLFAHVVFFLAGLFWSTCVTHHGPQPPTPWRVKGRFIAWWATLIAGWMLLLHLMIGAAWLVGWISGKESFLPYSTLVENRPMNSWQLSSIYWCFWIAFVLNIYGWRRSGRLVPEDDETEPVRPATAGSTGKQGFDQPK